MTSRALKPGDIITYPYRWARDLARGTAPEGGKDRPCCLVLAITTDQGQEVMFLAAISSKAPHADQGALEIPDIERRRAGLNRYPEAWIYIDELNRDEPARSWYLEPQAPIGAFSKSFLAKIAGALRERMRAVKIVQRR